MFAKKILEVLETKKYCSVAANDFLQMWFHETNGLQDKLFTKKLIDFSKNNGIEYIIVMNVNGRSYDAIKFWKKHSKLELVGKLNEQNSDDRSKTQDGKSDTECCRGVREVNRADGDTYNADIGTPNASAGDIQNDSN